MNRAHKEAVFRLRNGRGWELVQRHISRIERHGRDWMDARSRILSLIGMGFTFALAGNSGTGKTQLAVDIMLNYSDQLKTAEYLTAIQFFSIIKGTFDRDRNGQTEEGVMQSFCAPKLLVIDEFEKRSDSKWANDLIFELLNRRYGMVRDTLLLSNLTAKEFTQFLGAPLVSRINEAGEIVSCDWKPYR
jgi:DNA replication protein DnaC